MKRLITATSICLLVCAALAWGQQLDVELTPIGWGWENFFTYQASVVNNGPTQAPFWVWCRNRYPNGTYSSVLLGPIQIDPPVGITAARVRTQVVSSTWPVGLNYMIGYANPTVSYPTIDADSFSWVKLTPASGNPFEPPPYCLGEPFPYAVKSEVPMEFSLIGAHPNPFNPTTAISYKLQASSRVSLKVYDVSGRMVAELVNGWREAGTHQVTFDGTRLASGMYMCVLQSGGQTATGKMVLVK